MDIIVLTVVLASIAAVLFWVFFITFLRPGRKPWNPGVGPSGLPGGTGAGGRGSMRSCPLCKAALAPGWRVKSRIWKGGGSERLMHIFGCGYCYPPNTEHERVCPVCANVVPREGYVIARYFDTPTRKHVHVLGCTGCRRG